MGCFYSSRTKRDPPGSPQSVSSKDGAFLNNKPIMLPAPLSKDHDSQGQEAGKNSAKNAKPYASNSHSRHLSNEPRVLSAPSRTSPSDLNMEKYKPLTFSGPLTFSAPLTSSSILHGGIDSSASFSGPLGSSMNSLACDGGSKRNLNMKRSASSKRASGFGGRPQPLPVPQATGLPLGLPVPQPQESSAGSLSSSESRSFSGTSSFVSTSLPNSFSSQDGIGSWSIRRGKVMPVGGLPLPPPSVATKLCPSLEAYEFSELARATQDFAPEYCIEKGDFGDVYNAWVEVSTALNTKIKMAVMRLAATGIQGLKEWKSEIQMLTQLQDTHICMVKGYCAHDVNLIDGHDSKERLLVFEQLPNGSLHDYLFGSLARALLDWNARINIVLGAARGLVYLHDRARVQIVYRGFKASSILLDKTSNAKLAGYGMAITSGTSDKKSFATAMKISQAYAKSNVWSFGVVLLELLTGKYSRDAAFMCDEKNFVHWGKPFMRAESKLSLILDPRLRGKCSMRGAMRVAALVLQCLRTKEMKRPSMAEVVDALKSIKEDQCNRDESSKVCFKGVDRSNAIEAEHAPLIVQSDAETTKQKASTQSSEDENSLIGIVTVPSTCALETAKVNGCQGQKPRPFGEIASF